ncbi:MAG: putative prephenate dehydrogenase [Thermoleophilia bacterium]|nr:putative prephenate dehydrogenase [Thermoleophilia bacterium]
MLLRDATVGIVGLGLMGGSLGLALDGKVARRLGADVDEAAATRAVAGGAIDEAMTEAQLAARADLVVLAIPVRRMLERIPVIAEQLRDGAILTDVGSTKSDICAAFDVLPERISAIGGHPMCGREVSGIDAADGTLYVGARWVLVPTQRTDHLADALVGELVQAVGADVIEARREDHDRAVATASHLAYVSAQALVGSLGNADGVTDGLAGHLAATGFAGATRLAGGNVDVWLDILLTNREHVRESIGLFSAQLADFAALLDDEESLRRVLEAGRVANA